MLLCSKYQYLSFRLDALMDPNHDLQYTRANAQDYGAKCHFQQYFSNIVAAALLVEETGVPEKPSTYRKSLTTLSQYTLSWSEFELTALVVIGTDCMVGCKSKVHIHVYVLELTQLA